MKTFIHDTAIVDEGAQIGSGCRIWHFTHVSPGAKIGANVSLGQNVYVADNVEIGDNCKVQNNVSLYDGVILEEGVFCGPSMVFTNVYNPRSLIEKKDEYRTTLVKRGATIGANATIVCGVEIGSFSFIAAGAVINKNVKDYSLFAGVPAEQKGWMTETGDRLPFPLSGDGKFECPITGDIYLIKGNKVLKEV